MNVRGKRLDEVDKRILRFVHGYVTEHMGIPPTLREVSEASGIKSTSAVRARFQKLLRLNYLYAVKGAQRFAARSMTINERGRQAIGSEKR